MESPFTSLRVEFKEGLATITFTQPKRGNPIDQTCCAELRQVALDLAEKEGLRAILFCAEGPNFSFGGDLGGFKQAGDKLPSLVRLMLADMNMALSRLYQLPVPVIASVQGFCMGGMVGFIAGCDFIIAGNSTKFGAAFSGVGFSCDSGSSSLLTIRMGAARARRFQLMAETLSAEEALDANLIDKIVSDEELTETALKVAKRLASGPTQAYAGIKELFLSASGIHLETQSELECTVLARVSESEDSKEGTNAMLEKRKPLFIGS